MNSLYQYCFEVVLGSTLLFLAYSFLKKKIRIDQRRFVLLSCILIPILFPLFKFNATYPEITYIPSQINNVFIPVNPDEILTQHSAEKAVIQEREISSEPVSKWSFNWPFIVLFVYSIVSLYLLSRLCHSIYMVLTLPKNAEYTTMPISHWIVDKNGFTGASFFNWIFIHKKFLNTDAYDTILSHEIIHKEKLHSLDILLAECALAFMWFNPIFWIVRKEIRLNTELEADYHAVSEIGHTNYSNLLLDLSVQSNHATPMNQFSARDTKIRIRHLVKNQKKNSFNILFYLPVVGLSLWLISCEPEMIDFAAMDPHAALKNVKTVTTRYISHQKDTQQKDGKIIAIAYYLPNGTVDRVEQYMTYPYDFEKPFKRHFLAGPDPANVLHVLDGFGIGDATNNILYGDNWPKHKDIDDFGRNGEMFSKKITKEKNGFGLPTKYTIEEELNEDFFYQGKKKVQKGTVMTRYEENFGYNNGKVISHSKKVIYPSFMANYRRENNNDFQAPTIQLLHETKYFYEGGHLTEVINNQPQNGSISTTKINYENGIITSVSYFRNDKQYNNREFYYNQSGLKTRTEIFNVYGDPEYTILYDYEYY